MEPIGEELQAPVAQTSAPAPPSRERYEKQEKAEKHEKHEKHEKQEKYEKQGYEKGEKHEKRGWGLWGAIFGGILLIFFGFAVFFASYYGVPGWIWWPIFLIIVGIAVLVYFIAATTMTRRSPSPV